VSQQIGSFVNDEGGLAQSTRLSAGTSSSSAATRIITRLRLSRHGPGVHSLTCQRYLWHPLHLKRDIHGGAVKTERTSVHTVVLIHDMLYCAKPPARAMDPTNRFAPACEEIRDPFITSLRRTWHFVPHNHAAPRSPYSLDTVATESGTHSSAPLLQQLPPCIPHSAYVIILHSQS